MATRVVIVGGGFAGLNAAKTLSNKKDVEVLLIDRRNHHLFQPLLYQIATAGLSPADIASPIRGILSDGENVQVLMDEVTSIDRASKQVITSTRSYPYDYLILATGAVHSYFGNDQWEPFAPGLKTVEQATDIRRRILSAFEEAEKHPESERQKEWLTFVIVGGGPTGVEMAGAIAEISRTTLEKDFRRIDPARTRVILIEAGTRVLASFDESLSRKAARSLEKMGVQIWTRTRVTGVTAEGVQLDTEQIRARTVIWAAGVAASPVGRTLNTKTDRAGRVEVGEDLSIAGDPNVFVVGDLALKAGPNGQPLPGLAPVAMQQGKAAARNILADLKKQQRDKFKYRDKGAMATIGRKQAVLQTGSIKMSGTLAWFAWLFIHVFYLIGFRNRVFVLMQWAWSYLTFKRGARLIVGGDPNSVATTATASASVGATSLAPTATPR